MTRCGSSGARLSGKGSSDCMKCLIVCVSEAHGNTMKVAEQMAKVLKATIVRPQDLELNTFDEYDLVGFGSGIYYSRHHDSLLRLLDSCSPVEDKKAFLFATSGLPENKHLNDFNKPLGDKLKSGGFDIQGIFSCRGHDTRSVFGLLGGINKGKPDYRDLEAARSFALGILEKYSG